jgi:AraC family transcriptional regulator
VPDPRAYTARINRVLDYVDAHLADKLDLATLARVAYVSEWHFHRLFRALTGETPGDWVRPWKSTAAATVMQPETGRFSCQLCLPVRPA